MAPNRLRILVISNYYPPEIKGGLEISASIICNSLAKKGHEVVVLTRNSSLNIVDSGGNPEIRRIFVHKYRFDDIEKYHPRFAGWNSVNMAFLNGSINRPILREFIQENHFDVAICFSLADLGQSLANVIQEAGIPFVWSVGDYWRIAQRDFGTKGILAKLRRKLLASDVAQELNTNFENVVFISENFRREFELKGISPSNPSVIYRSYPVPENVPSAIDPVRLPRFVIASQIQRHKGIHIALHAAKRLNEWQPKIDWKLEIFGDGDELYLNELEDFVSTNSLDQRVTFHKKITPVEVAKLFQTSLAVIHPVIWQEPFGRVVIEAMANGAAVIAGDNGPIREILSDDYRLLYLPDDPASLAKHMEQLLTDSDFRRKIVKQNLVRHHELFTPEIELEKYEQILTRLCN